MGRRFEPYSGSLFFYGSLVKRLRRGPLTAETGVRFPYESSLTANERFEKAFYFSAGSWRHSQEAKASDCNSAIPGANPGVAFFYFKINKPNFLLKKPLNYHFKSKL